MLKEPAFDSKEFDELKRQDLAQLEEQKSDPQSLAFNGISRYLNPWPKGDPRYVSSTEESIADYSAATLDDAKRYYAEFYGAGDGTMAIVGDFDPAQVGDLVNALFGSWPSPKPFQRLASEYRDVPATGITIPTRPTPGSSRAPTSPCGMTTRTIPPSCWRTRSWAVVS